MATFTVDLITGNIYLFNGNFTGSGSTPIVSGSTYPEVLNYGNLPIANTVTGEIYMVRVGSGTYPHDRKDAGFYYSAGGVWNALPSIPEYFKSDNFKVYDSVDHTKGIAFITSGITAGTFRNVKVQNSDGTVAYLTDLNTKVDTSIFNAYSGATNIRLNNIDDDMTFISGITDTKLNITDFNVYSGITETKFNTIHNYLGNGVISGFTITLDSGLTTISISKGLAVFYDYLPNSTTPIEFIKECSGRTGLIIDYLTSSVATYLAATTGGTIIQQTSPFSESDRRRYLPIGAVIHSNKTTINAVNNLPDVALGGFSQFNDLLDGLNNFNKSGNKFSPNGVNLSINKSNGYIFKRGVNFFIDTNNPHVRNLPALIAPANIRYRLSDGTEYADTNVISKYYESAVGVRSTLGNNDFTIQRITVFPSNLTRIQYGQHVYNSMDIAIRAITIETFTVEQNIAENGLLRAYLIVAGRTTNLSDEADAIFIECDKFGTMPLGGGGIIGTLQGAYDNSIIPQISTTTALGALTIKRGSAADTDTVLQIHNGTGGTASKIIGTGEGTFNGLILPKATGIGIKVDTVTPTFGWADMVGNITVRTGAGSGSAPTLAQYIGNIYQYSYGTVSGNIEVFNEYHVFHDFVPNTIMYIHTHWSTNVAPTGNVNWMYDVTYAKGYNQQAFATPVIIPVVSASTTAFNHMISEVQLSAPNGLILSTVNVSITSTSTTLTSATPLFTSADIGRTIAIVGAGVAGATLNTTITAFASSTSVTIANAASTTVTAQPNFRYVVINSNNIEPDGLLLVRTWRNSSRTADTLDVAPFLHFVDIHYQSTNLPTKNKNYPFYT